MDTPNFSTCRIEKQNYWNYALPIINSYSDLFSEVQAAKEKKITTYLGKHNTAISCTANDNSARVEFLFYGKTKEENRILFDKIHSEKNYVESKIGSELIWERGDDTLSKIYCRFESGINDRNDWKNVAEFHGKMSSLFYEIIFQCL